MVQVGVVNSNVLTEARPRVVRLKGKRDGVAPGTAAPVEISPNICFRVWSLDYRMGAIHQTRTLCV